MKILITGAGGFLGKNLIQKLSPNHEIIATSKKIKELPIEGTGFIKHNIKLRKLDVTSPEDCFDVVKQVDVVIHLAAIIDVSYSIDHPKKVMDVNFEGSFNVLEAMRKNNIKKIVYLSTQDIYGNNINSDESDKNLIAPLNPYATSKFLSENLIKIYSSAYGIQYIILRPSHLYGDGQKKGIVPMLIEKISKGNTIEIGNDVKRDFLNVEDLTKAIELTIPILNNCIFNVGTGKSFSLKEIIQFIGSICGKKYKVKDNESLKRDNKLERWDEVANISKIKSMGYKPKWNIGSWLAKNI
jgi:UDP-glucose 4-epimerase